MFARSGLLSRQGFELWVMAEVPSVLFNLERYAELGVAGISIGSNDLTQLMLGADRDSEVVAEIFDEREPAVTEYLHVLITRARDARAPDLDLRPGAFGAPASTPTSSSALASTRSRSTWTRSTGRAA